MGNYNIKRKRPRQHSWRDDLLIDESIFHSLDLLRKKIMLCNVMAAVSIEAREVAEPLCQNIRNAIDEASTWLDVQAEVMRETFKDI